MDNIFDNIKHSITTKRWVQNVLAWAVFFLVFAITAQFDDTSGPAEIIIVIIALIAMLMVPVYITNLILLPLFQKKKQLLAIVLYVFMLVILAFAGHYIVLSIYWLGCQFVTCVEDFQDFAVGGATNLFGTNLLSTLIGLAFRIARDNAVEKTKNQEAELQLLKGQLNPHFLFNTLNNLYGLSVIKSDKLPGLMLKLSDLLRYSLYQTKDARVPLRQELTYLQNYLELERLRLDDKIDLSLQIEGDPQEYQVAPMLLIVFLENAFKHFGSTAGQAAFIQINISVVADQLRFSCINSKDTQAVVSPREQNASGIGLANVRQRLALLYPRQYRLDVQDHKTTFSVDLNLSLYL